MLAFGKWLISRLQWVFDAWFKAVADLSGTRTVLVWTILYLIGRAALRGIMLAKTPQELVIIINALVPLALVAFGFWFGGKALTANGGVLMSGLASRLGLDRYNEMPSEDPLARLDRLGADDVQ